jgi:transcriptional regulator with XRE-family HTH domain
MHKRITLIRTQNKFTQKQVADALGVSRSAYCGYETGRRKVDIATLRKLASFYNLKTSAFFEEEDSAIAENMDIEGAGVYVSELTKTEKEVLTAFRNSSKEKQKEVLKLLADK